MRRVIVNADDFGLSEGINLGIIRACERGILTSATLMANGQAFEQGVELARKNPKLGVGIHLNVVRGLAVAPRDQVSSLLSRKGCFYSSGPAVLRKLALGRMKSEEVEREFRAQMEKILNAGVSPTHLDSEKHIHAFPSILRIALKLGKEYGILKIRLIRERCLSLHLVQSFKSFLLSASFAFRRQEILKMGFRTPDRFYGLCHSGRMRAARLRKILDNLPEGSAEVMVHPGYITAELKELEKIFGSYYINKFRRDELDALCDDRLREVLRRKDIQLITFGEL
jgi:hopanoid biosynthesis associated protein HpnK